MSSPSILPPFMRVPIPDTEPVTMRTPAVPDQAADRAPSPKPEPTLSKPAETQAAASKPTNATVRKTAIDWETGAMVYRVIDEHSGATLSQSPDEALLRLRAYARQSGPDPMAGSASAMTGNAPCTAPGSAADQTLASTGITPRPPKTV